MGNVIFMNRLTSMDILPDRVLEAAVNKLEQVVIAGYDKDGNEYFASSIGNDAETIWLLERMKNHVLTLKD